MILATLNHALNTWSPPSEVSFGMNSPGEKEGMRVGWVPSTIFKNGSSEMNSSGLVVSWEEPYKASDSKTSEGEEIFYCKVQE